MAPAKAARDHMLGPAVSIQSSSSYNPESQAQNLVRGTMHTMWTTADGDVPAWATVTFPYALSAHAVRIDFGERYAESFEVSGQVSEVAAWVSLSTGQSTQGSWFSRPVANQLSSCTLEIASDEKFKSFRITLLQFAPGKTWFNVASLSILSRDPFLDQQGVPVPTELLDPSLWNLEDWNDSHKSSLIGKDFEWHGVCGVNGYKCVISYGVYGVNPKYLQGAMQNAKLVQTIYPGWVMRVYHDGSLPQEFVMEMETTYKVEFRLVTGITGGIAGMFWRFLVADDLTVDRYIIRDSDSRLNLREAHAVAAWLQSGFSIHSIRDHPNHDRGLNGGMWGGTKGAFKAVGSLEELIHTHPKGAYGADLDFLCNILWPLVLGDQISHDSWTCERYPNSKPFPTRRPEWQHVGQVFENPLNDQTQASSRVSDIDCCMRGKTVPMKCRGQPDWDRG